MHYYFFKNRYGLSSLSSTIYLDDDDDDEQLNSQQDNWRIEKFLKELFYEPQVFDPLPELQNMNVETENTTIPQMFSLSKTFICSLNYTTKYFRLRRILIKNT